jgi:rod shape determining protein RodA
MFALFIPAGILIAAGLIALSSISIHLFWLQLIWVGIGIGIIVFFHFVDWRLILNYRWVIGALYGIGVLLLLFLIFYGPTVRNTRSWIMFGPFNFQPVELVKIVLILLYANYFSRRHLSIARWRNIFTSFLFFAIPAGLVAFLPDLGSALVLFGIWFGFLLLSGLPPRRVLAAFVAFAVMGMLVWSYAFKDYQRARVIGVFYPERNALGINYSAAQSKIAVGSAGLFGKGYAQGTQVQLGFLTEPASDFVFAAFVEEWGILAGFFVIGAFLLLVLRILKIGMEAERNFEKFLCLGTATVFGLQFFLNIGSELGFLPVIGVTFPFISYGGSSLVANFFLLAVIAKIGNKK